ncbi:hypothetical protein CTAYLR_007562 [Chrysophaeum taylorii]|uniref:Mitochondrial carrier protein n=1 Tax=Chrysophaeum taylorii TaxID=2483200 RepID=A0AAD7U6S9_9STRA|nr:hypothetical protein CTAYLR_007562 [Chrysophaeum taylorii]
MGRLVLDSQRLATLPPIVLSSLVTAACLYPMDVVRSLRMGRTAPLRDIVTRFRSQYGWSGLFTQGVAAEVARAGVMRTLKFFMFPLTHEVLTAEAPSRGSPGSKALAGALCTLPEVACIMPLEVAKVGLQLDRTNTYHGSTARLVRRILVARGLPGLYAGYAGVQLRQSSWTAVYFSTVDFFRLPHLPPALQTLLAGFLAGVCGAVLNVPCDVVRTRVQLQVLDHLDAPAEPPHGLARFLRTGAALVATEGGLPVLWTGFAVKATHMGASGALMALCLPFFQRLLN